jgi:thiamine-phosphate pyrophosphorylase
MSNLLRILDANLNRAREGVRTAEEYARLYVQDATTAAALKSLRRDVQALAASLDSLPLLKHRDVEHDPGTRPQADDVTRASPADVAVAGIKRAQEALRAIEEYAQIAHPPAAPLAAAARYHAYSAEQQLFAASPLRARVAAQPVMVVFTRSVCVGDWRTTLRMLLDAGCGLFQLREKDVACRDLLAFAGEFRSLAPDALMIVNDRVDVARMVGADGVHLGQDDMPPEAARELLGPAALVGISTHDRDEALAAQGQSADYIGLGAMFETGTKAVQHKGGPNLLAQVRVPMPVFAIGGITPGNIHELTMRGARHVAVCSGVLKAERPDHAYLACVEALTA